FFFQAEDGIRDFHVTGVQTCALPISCLLWTGGYPLRRREAAWTHPESNGEGSNEPRSSPRTANRFPVGCRSTAHAPATADDQIRSEERRVGKERRSRRRPYHNRQEHI